MVKVAVAGGTGGIGRHIVEGILSTNKHSLIALSRSSSNPTLEALGVQIIAVDYNDHASLVSALDGVHTVISTIGGANYEMIVTAQLALLRAAVDAGVKRFAPSEFAVQGVPDDPMKIYRFKVTVVDALAKSGLEWTVFENGAFMNYFASGTKGVGYLQPIKFILDVEKGTAALPGTGDDKLAFTRGEDVGLFVASSLDLDKWPEILGMVGEVKTHNQVVSLAEKVTGRKFQVTYLSEQDLRKAMDPNPPSPFNNFYYEAMIEITRGRFMCDANLNALCPEVRPVGVEEFLRKWWSD